MRKEVIDKLTVAARGLSSPNAGIEQYKILNGYRLAADETAVREKLLSGLPAAAQLRYAMAAVDIDLSKLNAGQVTTRKVFGGTRKSAAISCKSGGAKVISVDITIDRNGGLVITQWVTKNVVTNRDTVIGLLSHKSSVMADIELDERFFIVYSCVRGITEQKVRTIDSLLTLASRQLTAQMGAIRTL